MPPVLIADAVLPPVRVDYETPFAYDDEADMTLQQAEKDIVEIKETLKWHGRIGWGAIGLYGVIFTGFLTWYLPKEMTNQKTEILQGVQLEIGRIPAGALNKIIVSNEQLTSSSPAALGARFQQASAIVNTALSSGLITTPASLTPIKTFVRTSLTTREDLPEPIRAEGVAAFVDVEGYSVFSQDMINRRPNNIFSNNIIGDEEDAKQWPMVAWLKLTPAEAHNVIARDNLLRGIRQDITAIRWLGNTFDRAVVIYNGGDLYLSNTIFKDCTFAFGNDPTSRKVQAVLTASAGKPVTLLVTKDFSSLPQ